MAPFVDDVAGAARAAPISSSSARARARSPSLRGGRAVHPDPASARADDHQREERASRSRRWAPRCCIRAEGSHAGAPRRGGSRPSPRTQSAAPAWPRGARARAPRRRRRGRARSAGARRHRPKRQRGPGPGSAARSARSIGRQPSPYLARSSGSEEVRSCFAAASATCTSSGSAASA